MRIRTPAELGALIRECRKKLGLDQKSLANRVGVSRQWIVEVEKGKPGAPIGLVLRTLGALGVALSPEKEDSAKPGHATRPRGPEVHVDIDSIVERARTKRK